MMGLNPAQSLRSFATSQPPLLVFTICLMAFGLTMVCLAYLIGEHELPNPDISMDWNKFLSKMAELEICIPQKYLKILNSTIGQQLPEGISHNANAFINLTSLNNSSALRIVDQSKSMSAVLSNVVDPISGVAIEETTYINISIQVPLWISGDINTMNSAPSHLSGIMEGKQLGLTGKLALAFLNVTLSIPPLSNVSCDSWCRISRTVCINLHMPSTLIPPTRSPEKCLNNEVITFEEVTVGFVEQERIPLLELCNGAGRLHFDYIPDTKLTEMLSIHERSIVNLHLMHTSYFMFVMVMTLLCYALIKGRYRSSKIVSAEKIPLDA